MPTIKNLGSEKEIQYTSLAEKLAAGKAAGEAEKKREEFFELANGFVHEHQFWDELKHDDRMFRVKMLATWLQERCDEAVDEAGSYGEGVVEGRRLQAEDDQDLVKEMRELRRIVGAEGEQTLVEALEWKLSEENRVLREELRELGRRQRKEGFELGVDEMRLRVENRANEEAEKLVKRGPDVK